MAVKLPPNKSVLNLLLQKALAATDMHLVGLLQADEPTDIERAETILVARLDKQLRHYLSTSSDADGTLLEAAGEFAEEVPSTLNDLQSAQDKRTDRLLHFARELISEGHALQPNSGPWHDLKAAVMKFRPDAKSAPLIAQACLRAAKALQTTPWVWR